MAIASNKDVATILTAPERSGLADYVPRGLNVGDCTTGAMREPDPSSYSVVLVPAMNAVSGLDTSTVAIPWRTFNSRETLAASSAGAGSNLAIL